MNGVHCFFSVLCGHNVDDNIGIDIIGNVDIVDILGTVDIVDTAGIIEDVDIFDIVNIVDNVDISHC